MPDDGLISLGEWSHEGGIDGWHNRAGVSICCSEAAIASDDTEHGGANRFCRALRRPHAP